jgi:hypothetical protein
MDLNAFFNYLDLFLIYLRVLIQILLLLNPNHNVFVLIKAILITYKVIRIF